MKDFKTQKQIENVETFFENEHLRWKSLYKEKYIPTDLAKIKRKITLIVIKTNILNPETNIIINHEADNSKLCPRSG